MRIGLLLAGAAAALAAGCASQEPRDIRLASYNIRICRGMDDQLNPDRTAAAIARLGAETVALNEVDRLTDRSDNIDEPKYLAEKLGMSFAFGKAFPQPGGDYGNAVISEYPVQVVEAFEVPGNGEESRGAIIVKIMAPEPYFVAVTHLPYEEELESVRAEGIAKIAAKLKEHNAYPAILMGDLNSASDGAAVKALRDAGFAVVNDAYPNELTWPADKPSLLLDYIAFYPADAFKVKEHFVADDPASSDHRPVVTVLNR